MARGAESPFIYVTCQPGAEKFVKADVARRHPDLRFSFSRPGFLTFKNPAGTFADDVEAPTPLARCWGPALGPALRGPSSAADAVARLAALPGAEGAVLHAFARDVAPPGEEPPGLDPWAVDAALAERVAAAAGGRWAVQAEPAPGQVVLDVVEVDPGVLFTGVHVHGKGRRVTPGGRPPRREPPPDTPSRVWLKLEEAAWWSGSAPGRGDVVLDIGCAPGGGTRALLDRGARVVGVDPGDMHPSVARHRHFQHLAVPFERLQAADLPRGITWVIYDVNLSPLMMISHLRRLLAELPDLREGFITLKLNTLDHVEKVDFLLEQLGSAGLRELRPAQLFHNRQELVVHVRR